MRNSMIDEAKKILEENGKEMKFVSLWEQIKKNLEITPEEEENLIGSFYTDLSLGGEFVVLEGNTWDLRVRHVFEKYKKDVGDTYVDIETSDDDAVEREEENEYNQSVNGSIIQDELLNDEYEEDGRKDSSYDYGYKKDDVGDLF